MATINTMQDLTRLLRENPDWRDELRRELLTEELLELPQRFAEYAKATDKRLDTIDHKLDSLRGQTLEWKLPARIPPLATREFDIRRPYLIWSSTGTLPMAPRIQAFEQKMEQAADDGVISDDEETRLRVTDLVMRSRRKSDKSTLWFAVETSGVINYEDITRAKRSANAITKMYEQDALPLVYGYRIDEEQRDLADQLEVTVFLDPDGD